MKYASLKARQAAALVAEAALTDMREDAGLADCEPGMYDLQEDGQGGLWILCGQDVELHVDAEGEQDSAYRDPEEKWVGFE